MNGATQTSGYPDSQVSRYPGIWPSSPGLDLKLPERASQWRKNTNINADGLKAVIAALLRLPDDEDAETALVASNFIRRQMNLFWLIEIDSRLGGYLAQISNAGGVCTRPVRDRRPGLRGSWNMKAVILRGRVAERANALISELGSEIGFKDPHIYERTGWDFMRREALARAGYKCQECGFADALNVHHVLPRSKGGTNDLSNLRVLCPNHHALEHRKLRRKAG